MARDKVSTQHGALPFVVRDGELQVLLITSRDTGRWLVPKGWPKKGLAPHKVAESEAYEEAGVSGSIAKLPFGTFEYLKRIDARTVKKCRVFVFPLAVDLELRKWPEKDERRREWVSMAEAAERVEEPGLSALLLSFAESRQKRPTARLA